MSGATDVRELRADIRHWRRGRAQAKLADVLQDAYIALFTVGLLGLMVGNVVLQSRRVFARTCTVQACEQARTTLPWLAALAMLLLVLDLARLFGPVFVSPATGSWLLASPLDRGALLRPTLFVGLGAAGLAGMVVALPSAALGGFGTGSLVGAVLLVGLLAVGLVTLAAVAQAGSAVLGATSSWLLGLATWAGFLLLALGRAPNQAPPSGLSTAWIAALGSALLLVVAGLAIALRRLPVTRRDRLASGGALAPGLSGAMATLDLALVYDVLLAHRWRGHRPVRSRRGGPSGLAGLVWLDLVRLRRTPQRVVVLAACAVAPYAAAEAGLGRVVVVTAVLVGFLGGLPLLTALRVVSRAPSITRALPFPDQQSRAATLVVPGVLLVALALAGVPALSRSLHVETNLAVQIALAIGIASLAAGARWVTGRPPDYTRPLVSTPAGGVPTNLYGSALRGFDVAMLTAAPLLIWPTASGVLVSLAVSAIVLSVLAGRR